MQVIFKSAKLLVAMLIRAVVFKKPNKSVDYYCGIMLSLGLIGFMYVTGSVGVGAWGPHGITGTPRL